MVNVRNRARRKAHSTPINGACVCVCVLNIYVMCVVTVRLHGFFFFLTLSFSCTSNDYSTIFGPSSLPNGMAHIHSRYGPYNFQSYTHARIYVYSLCAATHYTSSIDFDRKLYNFSMFFHSWPVMVSRHRNLSEGKR